MSKQPTLLSDDEAGELQQAMLKSKDGALRSRYQAVRLYGLGYDGAEIMDITGCSASRLRAWDGIYRDAGLAGLRDQRRGGNRARLSGEQIEQLRGRLETYTPQPVLGAKAVTTTGQFWTGPDLASAVEQWYGVRYQSPTSSRPLFAKCGFRYQKPAAVDKSRKESDVADFTATLKKNRRGNSAVRGDALD